MSIDEPTFTYDASKPLAEALGQALEEARRNPQPVMASDPLPQMLVCNHCGTISRDGFAMDVHWDTYPHHKGHGAHQLGSDPKDMDRLRDQQRELLDKMDKVLSSEAKAHQWEHRQPIGAVNCQTRIDDAHAAGVGAMQGLGAFLPKQRTFTREEVLTVIRAQMAHLPEVSAERPALRSLIRIFERME